MKKLYEHWSVSSAAVLTAALAVHLRLWTEGPTIPSVRAYHFDVSSLYESQGHAMSDYVKCRLYATIYAKSLFHRIAVE